MEIDFGRFGRPMSMKIKVISLRQSADRRNSIRKQLDGLELPFEFFDAVTPEHASHHIDHYDQEEFFRNCGRYATATEIACYASHLALWRQCVEEGVPYLILEDDAQLHSTFPTGMLVTATQINKLGFIRVSLPRIRTALFIDHLGPFDIKYCRRAPLLALGYALSPGSASRLANAAAVVEEPVDKFLQRFWRHGQPVFAVTPPIVELAELASHSDIGDRSKHHVGARVWIQRVLRKVQNSTLRAAYNLRFAHKTLRGQLASLL